MTPQDIFVNDVVQASKSNPENSLDCAMQGLRDHDLPGLDSNILEIQDVGASFEIDMGSITPQESTCNEKSNVDFGFHNERNDCSHLKLEIPDEQLIDLNTIYNDDECDTLSLNNENQNDVYNPSSARDNEDSSSMDVEFEDPDMEWTPEIVDTQWSLFSKRNVKTVSAEDALEKLLKETAGDIADYYMGFENITNLGIDWEELLKTARGHIESTDGLCSVEEAVQMIMDHIFVKSGESQINNNESNTVSIPSDSIIEGKHYIKRDLVANGVPCEGTKICTTCGNFFPNEDALSVHITLMHSLSSNNFVNICKICNGRFSSVENLVRHKKLSHNEATLSRYNCREKGCSVWFNAKGQMVAHIIRDHGRGVSAKLIEKERKQIPNKKCFICRECSSVFSSLNLFKRHFRSCHS